MTTPTNLILTGVGIAVLGLIAALANFATGLNNRSLGSIFAFHLIAGLFWVGGGITAIVGLIMFLIDYAHKI
jgi:hypothetical protein